MGLTSVAFSIVFLLAFPWVSRANIILPTGPATGANSISDGDRTQLTKMLGWGTSSKLLSEPYPLGGDSGLEVGISVETIPISQLAYMGTGTPPQQNFSFPKVNIGKGLYKDLDVFVHFIPYSEDTRISEYGGILRWGFYQALFPPSNFSLLVHANSSNVSNAIITQTYGADIVTGVTFPTFSFYAGAGWISSQANFMLTTGASGAINGAINTATASGYRTFLGGVFSFSDFFASFEVDQYDQTVFSTKFGVRY